jgi:hypothetical protein
MSLCFRIGTNEFGEAWHVAATLAIAPEQIEVPIFLHSPNSVPLLEAQRFFLDAVLSYLGNPHDCRVYRRDELFNQAGAEGLQNTTRLVADACKQDSAVIDHIQDVFLATVSEDDQLEVKKYLDAKAPAKSIPSWLIWSRLKTGDEPRSLSHKGLRQLMIVAHSQRLRCLVIGNAIPGYDAERHDFCDFFTHKPFFGQISCYQRHLALFKQLQQPPWNVKGVIGLRSGGMDGLSFLGVPTVCLTNKDIRITEYMKDACQQFHPIVYDPYSGDNSEGFSSEVLQEAEAHIHQFATN